MIAVVPDRQGETGRWRLVSRTPGGADVLALAKPPVRRPRGRAPRGQAWRQPVTRLRDAAGVFSVVTTADGHFQWVLSEDGGAVIAESPSVYRDGESCRRAFAAARAAARMILGSDRTPTIATPSIRQDAV